MSSSLRVSQAMLDAMKSLKLNLMDCLLNPQV